MCARKLLTVDRCFLRIDASTVKVHGEWRQKMMPPVEAHSHTPRTRSALPSMGQHEGELRCRVGRLEMTLFTATPPASTWTGECCARRPRWSNGSCEGIRDQERVDSA
jgi:hypothetical protein